MAKHASEAITLLRQLVHEDPENPSLWLTYAYLLSHVQELIPDMPDFYLVYERCCDVDQLQDRFARYASKDGLTLDRVKDIEREIRDAGDESWVINWVGGGDETSFVLGHRLLREIGPEHTLCQRLHGVLQNYVREKSLRYYFKASSLAFDPEDTGRRIRISGISNIITAEAAASFLALGEEWKLFGEDDPRKALAQQMLDLTEGLPPQAITPIIFSLNTPVPLESLLAPETIVSFDLDGTGRDQSWPWVSPETSILVWDPEETGEITSGRQLFGSVTWWLFFDDGYRAMNALDDNRDGELSGDELVGLAIWTDANSNGVSDEGEVVPIAETGIESIACVQTDTSMGMPANLSGLRMSDGRVLPTYDWVAEEVGITR